MSGFHISRRLNDAHPDKKRPRMSSEASTNTGEICQLGDNCQTIACITLKGKDNLNSCLLHFVAQLDATDTLVDAGVAILDEGSFHDQASSVSDLWKLAIGDVVMEMYQHQWQEEKSLAADPLSILTLNAPLQKKQLAQTMGGSVAHNQANTQLRERKLQSSAKETYSNGSVAQNNPNLYVQNPYARREPDRSNVFISKRTSAESHAQALIRKVQDDTAEEEAAIKAYREGNGGEICAQCASPWVVVRNSSAFEGTKSEIWGSKDVQASYFIECRKCKHVEHLIEGQ